MILVTGDLGFIGSHIKETLIKRGHHVRGLDIKRGPHEDVATVKDLQGVDVIIHQAGQSSQAQSIAHPAGDVHHNILGTLNLLQIGKQIGVRHFIFASTSSVYADAGDLTEDTPFAPRNPYGVTKLAAEWFVRTSGIPYTIFRYANVYGDGQTQVGENQIIAHCIDHLLNGKPFKIHGDGSKSRDFIHVDDIVEANRIALERSVYGVYNLGTEISATVSRICGTLASLFGKQGYEFIHDADRPGEAQSTRLVSTRFRLAGDWYSNVLLTDGLARTVNWWKKSRTI